MNKKIVVCMMFCLSLFAVDRGNLIESMKITKHRLDIKINSYFKEAYLNDDFFIEYQDDIDLTELDQSLLVLPLVMNVFSAIWISGDTYHIDSIDQDAYNSLQRVKELYKTLYPRTKWNGKLVPGKVVVNTASSSKIEEHKDHVAIMFSGGLDSIHTSMMHPDGKQLLITAWGQPDLKWHQAKRWKRSKKMFEAFAAQTGQEHTFFKSNHHEFLNSNILDALTPDIKRWWLYAVLGPCWAGLVAPIVVTRGYPVVLVSSSITWDFPYIYGTSPVVDDTVCFAGVQLRHYGFDKTRTQKCDDIQERCKKDGLPQPFLRICPGFDHANCCSCEKCLRTMAEVLVAGGDLKKSGFMISRIQAIKKIKEDLVEGCILKGKQNYTKVWFCQQIQKYLKNRFKSDQKQYVDMAWLLDVNFKPMAKRKSKNKIKMDWRQWYKKTRQ